MHFTSALLYPPLPLTFSGTLLPWLPQELPEELLSWEVGLFHMSPSSASHCPPDMPMSSPPDPQLSCIDLGASMGQTNNTVE